APPNTTSQQVLTALYSLALTPTAYQANFHDIQFGINGSCGPQCQANPGYDLLTGLGSPQGNALVPTLGALLGATPFPTATGTATSTRTPSPVPAQCSPRPVVGVTVVPGGSGRLQATISASSNPGATANRLVSLQFGQATGALIDVPGQPVGQTG